MTYRDQVLADGATGYWKLGDVGSGTAVDETGNLNLAVTGAVAAAALTPTMVDGAAYFDGLDDQVSGNTAFGGVNGTWSVEMWLALEADTSSYMIALVLGKYTESGLRLGKQNSYWHIWTDQSGGTIDSGPVAGAELTLGEPVHLVGTYDGTTCRFYVDGIEVAAVTGTFVAAPSTGNIRIGGNGSWQGPIDEAAIYDGVVLTAAQVKDHFRQGVAGDAQFSSAVLDDSPISYWALDERERTVGWDATGSGNHLNHTGPLLAQASLLIDGTGVAPTYDGVDDQSTAPSTAGLGGASGFVTVEGWVRFDVVGFQVICSAMETNSTGGWYLYVDPDGRLALAVSDGTTVVYTVISSILTAGQAYYVVATIDVAGNVTQLWVDGQLVSTGTANNILVDETGSFYIGSDSSGGNNLDGAVDGLAVYDRLLTNAEIRGHYSAGGAITRALSGTGSAAASAYALFGRLRPFTGSADAAGSAFGAVTDPNTVELVDATMAAVSAYTFDSVFRQGTYTTARLDLSRLVKAGPSRVWWDASTPTDTAVIVEASVDGGRTWRKVRPGGPVRALTRGTATAGRRLRLRATLTSSDPTVEPTLHDIGVQIDSAMVTEYAELGTYGITDTDIAETREGVKVQITGLDVSRYVAQNRWDDDYVIPSGTIVSDAVAGIILDRYPAAKLNFVSTAHTTTRIVLGDERDNNPWEDARDIARGAGLELFVDGDDWFVLRRRPDVTGQASVWDFAKGEATVLAVDRQLSNKEAYNRVVVESSASELVEPIRAEAWVDDPNSPYYIGDGYGTAQWVPSAFGDRPRFLTSSFIKTQQQAQDAADALLLMVTKLLEKVDFTAMAHPVLEAGDVVRLRQVRSGVDGYYLLARTTVPLGGQAPQTFTSRKRGV